MSWNKKIAIHVVFYLSYVLEQDGVSDDDFSYLRPPFMFSWCNFHFRGEITSEDRYDTVLMIAKVFFHFLDTGISANFLLLQIFLRCSTIM